MIKKVHGELVTSAIFLCVGLYCIAAATSVPAEACARQTNWPRVRLARHPCRERVLLLDLLKHVIEPSVEFGHMSFSC